MECILFVLTFTHTRLTKFFLYHSQIPFCGETSGRNIQCCKTEVSMSYFIYSTYFHFIITVLVLQLFLTDPFKITPFTPDYIKMFVDWPKSVASTSSTSILNTPTVIGLVVPPWVKSHLYSSACTLAVSSITVRSSSLNPVNIHLISAPTLPQRLPAS